jgi:hypothetical protein
VSASSDPTSSDSSGSASLGAAGAELAAAVKRRAGRLLELAAAESGLAAMSGISMVVLAIVTSALLIVAWILLVSVVGYALVLVGVPWIAAGLVLAVVHLAVAYYLFRKAMKLSRDLTWPALRSALFSSEE